MSFVQIGDASGSVCDAGFSGSEFGVQGTELPYRGEAICDQLETWAKSALTFTTTFQQRCVVKLAFLVEVRHAIIVLSMFAKPVLALTFPY